jgi:hypothetical protein
MKHSGGCHSGLSGIIFNYSEGFPARFTCGNDNFMVFNRRRNNSAYALEALFFEAAPPLTKKEHTWTADSPERKLS